MCEKTVGLITTLAENSTISSADVVIRPMVFSRLMCSHPLRLEWFGAPPSVWYGQGLQDQWGAIAPPRPTHIWAELDPETAYYGFTPTLPSKIYTPSDVSVREAYSSRRHKKYEGIKQVYLKNAAFF